MNAQSKLLVVFTLFALTLAACAPAGVQAAQGTPTSQPSPVPTNAGSGAVTPTASGGTSDPGTIGNITLANNGQTITLHVDQTFLLDLGLGYTWSLNLDNQNVISRVPNISVIRGAQGIYRAHQPGTATLTATGDPECRQSTPPCAVASVVFTLHINVQ